MKISELLKRVEELPQPIEFDWPGVEQWNDKVFANQVQTLEEGLEYIRNLKNRVAEQSHAISDLKDAYNALINWIRDLELTT